MPAANPLRGEASFEAGDHNYTLALDINALILAEDASGWDMPALLDRLDKGNWRALRAIVWAGLQKHHECNLLRAAEIIVEAGVPVATAAMRKAVAAAFPAADPDAAKNPPKAADGTGSGSSADGALKA